MASPCFAILTQPFRSFHKKEKKKKSKSNRGRRAPLLSPDRMNHSVIFFRFTLISLREGCRFSNTWQQVSLSLGSAVSQDTQKIRSIVNGIRISRTNRRESIVRLESARIILLALGGMERRAVFERVPANTRAAELEKRPYAFLANPTTEIIILADILANVRMQFYLLLSWETR